MRFSLLSCAAALLVAPPSPLPAQTDADPLALRAESLMVAAMGGRAAWESARFFDFVWAIERGGRTVERRHVWDRWTGRYKLEAPLGEGQQMVALFTTTTREGRVWVDGQRMEGDSARTLLERAYAIYINDSYWFIMPFKCRDPGVNLLWRGTATDAAGQPWDQIELTFENVGLTPNNRYELYLDPETHLIGWWEHFRNRADTTTNTRTRWTQWERRGPILVSLDRPFLSGDARIYFPRAVISTDVDETAFAPPGR